MVRVEDSLYIKMPIPVRDRFKGRCEDLKVTMHDKVIDLIKETIGMKGTISPPDSIKVEEKDTCKLYIRKVPSDIKRKFKVWCAKQGTDMTEALATLIACSLSGQSPLQN